MTTGRRFFHSTIASYGSVFMRSVVSFAARMILARLVIPEGHGLYELALRVLFIAAAFRDLGLPFHLMRDPRRPYGTVLAFSLFQSVLLTLGLILIAPAFAVLDPELPRVLRVFAPWLILDGLVVVPRTFFERELRIDRLVVPEIVRGLVVAVVSVGLAYFIGAGVWSFVYADLAAAAVFAGLVWLRVGGTMPLEVQPALVPELIAKSKWLFAIWIVVQFVTYIDVYIVEAFRDTATVGQYARAYMIAFLVPQIVAPRALLPALVEYRDDPRRFLMAFRLGTVVLLAFQVVAGYFLFFNAPKVVAIILGDQWKPAVPLLMVLCFVPFLDVFTDLGGEVLKVRNEDRIWLVTASINLISLVFFGILLTRRFGALGMAWANFLLLGNLLMAWRMSRIFASGFRFLMRDLALVYTVPLPGFLLTAALLPADSWPRFAGSMAAAALALAVLGAIFYRSIRDFILERDPGAG